MPTRGRRRDRSLAYPPAMVTRKHLPLWDGWDDHAPGTLTWLQAWYAQQCDGDWEHGYGINIETLDNPGWRVRINLAGTELENRASERSEVHRSEHDWVVLTPEPGEWSAACGPLNLGEALHLFREWAEGAPRLADRTVDPA